MSLVERAKALVPTLDMRPPFEYEDVFRLPSGFVPDLEFPKFTIRRRMNNIIIETRIQGQTTIKLQCEVNIVSGDLVLTFHLYDYVFNMRTRTWKSTKPWAPTVSQKYHNHDDIVKMLAMMIRALDVRIGNSEDNDRKNAILKLAIDNYIGMNYNIANDIVNDVINANFASRKLDLRKAAQSFRQRLLKEEVTLERRPGMKLRKL